MPLYLGFDVQSESVTAIVIEIGGTRRLAFHRSIGIDSPAMWEDALDRIMGDLAVAAELDLDDLRGISGAAAGPDTATTLPAIALLGLSPSRPLGPQLRAIVPGDDLRVMHESPRAYFARLLAAPYWERRYSLPVVRLVPWQSTEASTLIGTGIIRPGLILIALGDHDTLAGVGGVLTFRNGSRTRDAIRLEHHLDAAAVGTLLEQRPGNDGCIMLPWLEDEATPRVVHAGVRRFGFDRADAARNVRGVIEGQLMAMANHAAAAIAAPIDRIIVTGAEAGNYPLLQVMANVFGAEVYWLEVGNAAALGAALRAYQADRLDSIEPVSWKTVVSGFTEPNPAHRVSPNPKHVAIYAQLRREYAILEHLHKDQPPIC
jgi:sugar (pentulose or hexulose) kinase